MKPKEKPSNSSEPRQAEGKPIEESTVEPVGFGTILREKREQKGYSQKLSSEIIGVTMRTVERWESGSVSPQERMKKRILRKLEKSTSPPSRGRITYARRHHHIDWEKGRGWFMRVTINVGAKTVGKRIKFRLKTRELEEAIKRRDVVFSSYKAIGFQVDSKGVVTIGGKK